MNPRRKLPVDRAGKTARSAVVPFGESADELRAAHAVAGFGDSKKHRRQDVKGMPL
jgi:hypothetical protein